MEEQIADISIRITCIAFGFLLMLSGALNLGTKYYKYEYKAANAEIVNLSKDADTSYYSFDVEWKDTMNNKRHRHFETLDEYEEGPVTVYMSPNGDDITLNHSIVSSTTYFAICGIILMCYGIFHRNKAHLL